MFIPGGPLPAGVEGQHKSTLPNNNTASPTWCTENGTKLHQPRIGEPLLTNTEAALLPWMQQLPATRQGLPIHVIASADAAAHAHAAGDAQLLGDAAPAAAVAAAPLLGGAVPWPRAAALAAAASSCSTPAARPCLHLLCAARPTALPCPAGCSTTAADESLQRRAQQQTGCLRICCNAPRVVLAVAPPRPPAQLAPPTCGGATVV